MTVTKKTKLLKSREAAERARVSPRTIARWLRDGDLKGVKLNGHSWRIDSGVLDKFIAGKAERPE